MPAVTRSRGRAVAGPMARPDANATARAAAAPMARVVSTAPPSLVRAAAGPMAVLSLARAAAVARWKHLQARADAALMDVEIVEPPSMSGVNAPGLPDNYMPDAHMERLYTGICDNYALYVETQQNVADPEVRAKFSTVVVDYMRELYWHTAD